MTAICVGQLWQSKKWSASPPRTIEIEAIHHDNTEGRRSPFSDVIVYRFENGSLGATRYNCLLTAYELKPEVWEVNRKYKQIGSFGVLKVTAVDKEGNALVHYNGSLGVRTSAERKNFVETS